MNSILQTAFKYLLILFFAIFTIVSFTAQVDIPDEKKKGRYTFQCIAVFIVHLAGSACTALNIADGTVHSFTTAQFGALYAAQLLYLVFMMMILPHIVRLSRGMNNVMCMLIVTGFIIQTRLNFDASGRQFFFLLAASAVFLVFQIIYKLVRGLYKLTWAYFAAGMILILIVLVFASVDAGAKIAIDLGFISFQPFEFVKILFVLFVAGAFNKANSLKMVIITAAGAMIQILLMVMCTELGTALILFVVYILMLYASTKKFRYVILGTAAFAAACVAAYFMFAHVRVRVSVWLDPWADIDGRGYQITQSLFAIGSGGWLGTGLYKGSPLYVPMVANDFVFSAISEELGAVFSIFLILLCLCFVLMIFRVAVRVYDKFNKLAAFGLGCTYGIQVFLTIGGAIKMIPSTGINLPFISTGGSSVLASMLIAGIVQGLYAVSEKDAEFEKEIISESVILMKDGREAEAYSLISDAFSDPSDCEDEREEAVSDMIGQEDEEAGPELYMAGGRIRSVDPDEDPLSPTVKITAKKSYRQNRVRQVDPDDD